MLVSFFFFGNIVLEIGKLHNGIFVEANRMDLIFSSDFVSLIMILPLNLTYDAVAMLSTHNATNVVRCSIVQFSLMLLL